MLFNDECIFIIFTAAELLYMFLEKMQFNTHSITEGQSDQDEDFENG